MFIVWSSNLGIICSSNGDVQKTIPKRPALQPSFYEKYEETSEENSVVVSINNHAKSSFLGKQNLSSFQDKGTLNALNINSEDLGYAFNPAAISNVYKHIIKEFH